MTLQPTILRRLWLLIVLSSLTLFLPGYTSTVLADGQPDFGGSLPSSHQIEQFAQQAKEESEVKALLVGVWQGEQQIAKFALGESMTDVPASTDMHVRIGGISQTFFSSLLVRLAEQGVISLDDRLSRWMPELLMADQVTLEMLINATAGYQDYVLDQDFANQVLDEPFRTFHPDELIAFAVREGEMNFFPGSSQSYSHTNYVILAQALEQQTGKTLAQLFQEQVFQPAGLVGTVSVTDSNMPTPTLHAFSSDRGVYEDSTFWNPSWAGASGPIVSHLDDLRRWGPIFGRGELVSAESFQKMTERPDVPDDSNTPERYFAFGFGVVNGWFIQNPNFNGYSGAFGYLPSRDLTVYVFSTQSDNPDSASQSFPIFQRLTGLLAPEAALAE